jgi:hypothetical protein
LVAAPRYHGGRISRVLKLHGIRSILDYIAVMTDALQKLIDTAKTANPTAEHREQQRRSFVYGNTHFENELITREMVDREAEKLAKEKK